MRLFRLLPVLFPLALATGCVALKPDPPNPPTIGIRFPHGSDAGTAGNAGRITSRGPSLQTKKLGETNLTVRGLPDSKASWPNAPTWPHD